MWLFSRGQRRRLSTLIAMLAGNRQAGFLIPYRHADAAKPRENSAMAALLADREPVMHEWLELAAAQRPALEEILGAPPLPRFTQDWFPRLDGLLAFTMVSCLKPARILEIGSGHSTRFMAAAIARHRLSTRLTAVDPQPRADIARLPIDHQRRLFDASCMHLADTLHAGDILFIDSSHIAMPGTDVDLLMSEIVPSLPSGVIVHVHDIFLPDPYPRAWTWRGYNEQGLVAALHLGGALEPLFSSHWAASRLRATLHRLQLDTIPLASEAYETSLWSRRA